MMKRKYFYGIKDVEFIWHGEWCDPEIIWKNQSFDYYDLENPLYDMYCEEHVAENMDFKEWLNANIDEVYDILQCLSDNKCFYGGRS